jgi:ATP-dependent helicase/nuclease subunit B
MNIFALPADVAYLPALAAAWLQAAAEAGRTADEGMLLLPTRRSARALAGAFLAANGGQPMLLPRIVAIGALDEVGLALSGVLDQAPAIGNADRQAVLAQLILARAGKDGAPTRLADSWKLAADLAALLDEAAWAEIDLAAKLPGLVEGDLAIHWEKSLQFLSIVTGAWPAFLAESGLADQSRRAVALIDAQATQWRECPPAYPVWLSGLAGAPPSIIRLARVIAGLKTGAVYLGYYDRLLPDHCWADLADHPTHPQAGLAELLAGMSATRDDVMARPPATASHLPAGRAALLSRAALPATALDSWQKAAPILPEGLSRLAPRDEQEEALSIALLLRDALQTPGRSAALVTPDRALALRVAAELGRFDIRADDSAGEPLAGTPPAILLRLAARAAAESWAPVPLLALLKHPLVAFGYAPPAARAAARQFELAALRGPRPPPGLGSLEFRLDQTKNPTSAGFLASFRQAVQSLDAMMNAIAAPPAACLTALIETAEYLAATDEQAGAASLWSGEAGAALAELLSETLAALDRLPDMAPADLPDLLDALLEGAILRRPRAHDQHPRIAIWGVQEARLQSVDVLVLAGLSEGAWPAETDPGPWLSRVMRRGIGLPSSEAAIGAAAHDFFALAASSPVVVLSAPKTSGRAPCVPSRFLARIETMLAGAHLSLPLHPASDWARLLDRPVARIQRPKPAPRPPSDLRPRSLSISEIATLMADPYAVYARKILKIGELDELDAESDAASFGTIVHNGIAAFFAAHDPAEPDAGARLTALLLSEMRLTRPRAALAAWWAARLQRLAHWLITTETQLRAQMGRPLALAVERDGKWLIEGGFAVNARADRLERKADGLVSIIDYKTGSPAAARDLVAGNAPQLPIEAVMAELGCFGPDFAHKVSDLAFWKLSGGAVEGKIHPLFAGNDAELRSVIDAARRNIPDLFKQFSDPMTAYLNAPHPGRAGYASPYDAISRRAEWQEGE